MHQYEKISQKIESKNFIIGMRDDGIVHVYFKPKTELDVVIQMEMLSKYWELTDGKMAYFIFESGEYFSLTKEARLNAATIEDQTPILSTALFAPTLAYKLIAEIYYKFNIPKRPYKIVSDFDKGINWLLSLRKEAHKLDNQIK